MADVERRLGARITALRKRQGLTQAALAETVGVTTETISRLERGSAVPSLARIEDIAAALKVKLHELFDFGDKPSPSEQAVDELRTALRDRDPQLVLAVSDIATLLLNQWPRPQRPPDPVDPPQTVQKRKTGHGRTRRSKRSSR